MSYDQYWHGDVWLIRDYREADKLRQERMNTEAWWQGAYIYDALLCVAPILHAFPKKGTKPTPYPSKPYPIGKKTPRDEENDAVKAKLYMLNMVRAGKNWGK